MQLLYFFALTFGLISCNEMQQEPSTHNSTTRITNINNIASIPLPDGYKRINFDIQSFAYYSRNIPLNKDNTVYLFNGQKKGNQTVQYAVLNIDVGNKDLQQCADAAMRLRAEYLFSIKENEAIAFQFSNGFNCDFNHYANGYRVSLSGNSCKWIQQANKDDSHASFRKYLDIVYSYAGTKSLYNQMKSIPFSSIEPGCVLLQRREPYGHAVTVMDMAYNPKTNDTIFLLSQSYMPAQSIHILRNPMNKDLSPWYSIHGNDIIETPEWSFTKEDLKAF